MALCNVMPHSIINITDFFNVTSNCAMQIKRGIGQSITTLFCSHLIYIMQHVLALNKNHYHPL